MFEYVKRISGGTRKRESEQALCGQMRCECVKSICCDGFDCNSLRGRRSKRKGKGIRPRDHARGRREEGNACKEAIVFAIPPTN